MQAGNKPEMQALMQSLQFSGTGKTVALSFQVPAEFINAMASKHESRSNSEIDTASSGSYTSWSRRTFGSFLKPALRCAGVSAYRHPRTRPYG